MSEGRDERTMTARGTIGPQDQGAALASPAVRPLNRRPAVLRACGPFAAFALGLLLYGCRPASSSEPTSPVLATVNGRAITQADFDEESSRRPSLSAEATLSNLVERQAMLIRAEASGAADTPAFRRDTENRLISQWLVDAYQKEREAITVTEEELGAAYETRREQLFIRPPLTRYAILYRKGRDLAELTGALEEAVARFEADRAAATNNGRLQGFGKIAADHSEDTISRYRGGDLSWVGDDTASRIPAEVLTAGKAQALHAVSKPMAAGDGVYVIMKTDERDATQLDFKEAAPALRKRLLAEKQTALESRFKKDLMGSVTVVHKASPVAAPQARKDGRDTPPAFPMPAMD